MNKNNTLKLLTLIITAGCGLQAYGKTEVGQMLKTAVQPTVSIEKTSAVENATVTNPNSGVHGGLQTVFTLQTNETDENYDYIMTSSITLNGDTVSAYGNNGCIVFAHTTDFPTLSAVNNAKSGGSNNPNVIAYPVTVEVTSPMTSEYNLNHATYGACYVINVNESNGGTVTHSVGTTPIPNTFDVTRDSAGIYKAVVTFSAIAK